MTKYSKEEKQKAIERVNEGYSINLAANSEQAFISFIPKDLNMTTTDRD